MTDLRVAVVGGGGQVGSALVERLSTEPALTVWGVCRNPVTALSLVLSGNQVRYGSVTEPDKLEELVGDADVIVNSALANALPGAARQEDEALLRAICGVPGVQIVHFSSVEVYGKCIDAQLSSFEDPRPNSSYGRRKMALERSVRHYAADAGNRCTVLRLGHVYGHDQWLSRAVLEMATEGSKRLPYDGALAANAVHIANVAAAVGLVARSGSESGTRNVFDPDNPSWRATCDWNTSAAGLPPLETFPADESDLAAAEHRRAARETDMVRLAGEMTRWAKTLPASLVKSCPTLRELGRQGLSRLPLGLFERRLRLRYHAAIAAAGRDRATAEPWMVSDPAPGPQLDCSDARVPADEQALREWWRSASSPDGVSGWGV